MLLSVFERRCYFYFCNFSSSKILTFLLKIKIISDEIHLNSNGI